MNEHNYNKYFLNIMKNTILLFMLVFTLSLQSGCIESKQFTQLTPYNEFMNLAHAMRKSGVIACVGQGQSVREDIAQDRAHADGRAKLALALDTKTWVLKNKFEEEIGIKKDLEMNDAFSRSMRLMAGKIIKGSFPADERIIEKGDMVNVYVLMTINPSAFNQFFIDVIERTPQVYECFKTSQAYIDLKNEMSEYETNIN